MGAVVGATVGVVVGEAVGAAVGGVVGEGVVVGVLVGTGPRIREVFIREFVGTFQSTRSHGVAPTGSRSLQRVIAKAPPEWSLPPPI